jgi:hypothetical protein
MIDLIHHHFKFNMNITPSILAMFFILVFSIDSTANAQTDIQPTNPASYHTSHQPTSTDGSTKSEKQFDDLLGAQLLPPTTQTSSANSANLLDDKNRNSATGNPSMANFLTEQIDPYANLSFIEDNSDGQPNEKNFEPKQAPRPTLTSKHQSDKIRKPRADYEESASIYTNPW